MVVLVEDAGILAPSCARCCPFTWSAGVLLQWARQWRKVLGVSTFGEQERKVKLDCPVTAANDPLLAPLSGKRSDSTVAVMLQLQRTAGNSSVTRLLASDGPTELLRVSRQPDGGAPDAGPADAGVPLPGGVPPTEEEREDTRVGAIAPDQLADEDLGPALEAARRHVDQARYDAILEQLRQRDDTTALGIGVGLPLPMPQGVGGTALVTPDVAVAMLENMIGGRPPFRPELGVGGCSWFTTSGNPYTGVGAANSVPIQAELLNTANATRFDQAALERIYEAEATRARPEVEAQVRDRFRIRTGRDAPPTLSRALADKVTRQLRQLAERRMWEQVAAQVRASPTRVGEVILPGGTPTPGGPPVFSRAPGRFTVVADAANIRVRGGPMPLVQAIEAAGGGARVAPLEASAAELAQTMRFTGRLRTALRVGGKVLIVVAVAVDLYEIIIAEDHLEATIVSLAGWGGAAAGAAAFSALWTPADVAGPWAWAGHGVGMLVSGAVGYWAGAETTRYVYRLVVHSRGQVSAAP
jgi:hypothetical protein